MIVIYIKSEKREWRQHVNYFNFMFFGHTEKSWWWINIKLGHLIQKKSRIILMPKIPQNYDGFKVSEKSNWCWLMCLEAYVLYNQLALLILKPTRFTWWLHFAVKLTIGRLPNNFLCFSTNPSLQLDNVDKFDKWKKNRRKNLWAGGWVFSAVAVRNVR